MVQTSTVATISAATIATGLLVYFDYNRRKNADFRRSLRREERRQARVEKEMTAAQIQGRKKQIHAAVDSALEEGFPTGVNEKEQFFMDHVQQGEGLAQDREFSSHVPASRSSGGATSRTVDAALMFYKALKVYPIPKDLVEIYDKTVDKRVIDVMAEMIAYDKDLRIDDLMPRGFSAADLPHPGLD
ncbi:hypothetical protein DL766_003818 [Monosporascus sp. MC13-8B]|uniref:Mitochondrial import receptor subunit tom-20 n=1 Tax=Monosporascus cannonballus TaxID=155416 RepID=A0ABY0GSJ0_9PEZI|nr:hypothetical protein DL762_009910 [Monosporascus cannonballus]RYO81632.1 hypothetical protein DL763_008511 [Monosporascus cannonballus]RYP32845.1 hypothetical protein DL766_003818 [Monosporascus sp. MC13-8B]